MKNLCDDCDKTKCIITSDPIEGFANLMMCRKNWGRMEASIYLSKNGWNRHQLADFFDEPEDDYYEDEEEYEDE